MSDQIKPVDQCPERIFVQVNANGKPLDHRWFEIDDERSYNEEFVRGDIYILAEAEIETLKAQNARLLAALTKLCDMLPKNDLTLSSYYARDELIAARSIIAEAGKVG